MLNIRLTVAQAQNETSVVFMPRAVKIIDESVMLGEIVISGQHETLEVTDASTKTPHGNAVVRGNAQRANGDEHVLADGPGDAHNTGTLEDMDVKSWSAMTSQKRGKVLSLYLDAFAYSFCSRRAGDRGSVAPSAWRMETPGSRQKRRQLFCQQVRALMCNAQRGA